MIKSFIADSKWLYNVIDLKQDVWDNNNQYIYFPTGLDDGWFFDKKGNPHTCYFRASEEDYNNIVIEATPINYYQSINKSPCPNCANGCGNQSKFSHCVQLEIEAMHIANPKYTQNNAGVTLEIPLKMSIKDYIII